MAVITHLPLLIQQVWIPFFLNSDGSFSGDVKKDDTDNFYGTYTDKDGNVQLFIFNDATDAESIISSTTNGPMRNADKFFYSGINIGASTGDFLLFLNVLAGMDSPFFYALQESIELGNMDYAYQIIKDDPSINNNVTVIEGDGFNNFDLGNYYWGKNMAMFGFSATSSAVVAHIFALYRHLEPDTPADQPAINNGVKVLNKILMVLCRFVWVV